METDLLIIGGGPAGLSAAYEPARHGLKVTIVDESLRLGGQLNQQSQVLDLPSGFAKQTGMKLSQFLQDRLLNYDVDLLTKCTMIGTYKDGRIGVTNGNTTFPIQSQKTIITTGAAEDSISFPGWTLPGVMTIGAAQILLNREKVLPGKKAIVLGTNNLAFEITKQLNESGVEVIAIIEQESTVDVDADNIAYLKQANIPIYVNSSITRARGPGEVEMVLINNNGTEVAFDVDLVCIAGGLFPILEPFQVLGCELIYLSELGGWLPKYDTNFETSIPNTYVAGNAAGITAMKAIMLTGDLAGISILDSLENYNSDYVKKRKESLWTELAKAEQPEVWSARLSLIKEFELERKYVTSNR
ncbi:FAD-dependent oxidoreductase [Ornithinibacillus sp. JPR2-1]|uniref:NAD(P)/FAD-dependent oxidoreductase n=1 Tax=Ornithinibacillus sp. JPR2-1 TaxID=2094019 RepID=UPI0031D21A10